MNSSDIPERRTRVGHVAEVVITLNGHGERHRQAVLRSQAVLRPSGVYKHLFYTSSAAWPPTHGMLGETIRLSDLPS